VRGVICGARKERDAAGGDFPKLATRSVSRRQKRQMEEPNFFFTKRCVFLVVGDLYPCFSTRVKRSNSKA